MGFGVRLLASFLIQQTTYGRSLRFLATRPLCRQNPGAKALHLERSAAVLRPMCVGCSRRHPAGHRGLMKDGATMDSRSLCTG